MTLIKDESSNFSDFSLGRLITDLDAQSPYISSIQNDVFAGAQDIGGVGENSHAVKLEEFLQSSADGRAILAYSANNNGRLDGRCRKQLCHLLINNELANDSETSITTAKFLEWSREIVKLFPKELQAVYYAPYVQACYSGHRRCASGKLYDSYHNKKRTLRKQSGSASKKTRKTSSTATTIILANPTKHFPDLDEEFARVESDIKWLNTGMTPWSTVEEKWNTTAAYRLKKLFSSIEGLVHDYMLEYPALKLPLGYRLLEIDFDRLFPNKTNLLHLRLVTYSDNIISYAQEQLSDIRDKTVREKITELLSFNGEDNKLCAALLILPFILPTIVLKNRKDSKRKKPSKLEVSESFSLHVPSENNIETSISEVRNRLKGEGKTLQPLIVYCGENINSVTSAYVVVDSVLYKFTNILSAVDTCYKIFHAVNAEYPQESKLVWLFIQIGLYSMNYGFKDQHKVSIYPCLSDMKIDFDQDN